MLLIDHRSIFILLCTFLVFPDGFLEFRNLLIHSFNNIDGAEYLYDEKKKCKRS